MCVREEFVLKNYSIISGLIKYWCFRFCIPKSYARDVIGQYVLETLQGKHDYLPHVGATVRTFLYLATHNMVQSYLEYYLFRAHERLPRRLGEDPTDSLDQRIDLQDTIGNSGVAKMYAAGYTMKEIGRAFGVTPVAIKFRLADLNNRR